MHGQTLDDVSCRYPLHARRLFWREFILKASRSNCPVAISCQSISSFFITIFIFIFNAHPDRTPKHSKSAVDVPLPSCNFRVGTGKPEFRLPVREFTRIIRFADKPRRFTGKSQTKGQQRAAAYLSLLQLPRSLCKAVSLRSSLGLPQPAVQIGNRAR